MTSDVRAVSPNFYFMFYVTHSIFKLASSFLYMILPMVVSCEGTEAKSHLHSILKRHIVIPSATPVQPSVRIFGEAGRGLKFASSHDARSVTLTIN
jgi:hypothetical protein